jgi:hypothetical protein
MKILLVRALSKIPAVRAYTPIKGHDPEIDKILDPMMGVPTPDADPRNYGGERLDGFIGASFPVGPLSLGVEGGIPLYQYLNGLQLKNECYVTAGIQGMF